MLEELMRAAETLLETEDERVQATNYENKNVLNHKIATFPPSLYYSRENCELRNDENLQRKRPLVEEDQKSIIIVGNKHKKCSSGDATTIANQDTLSLKARMGTRKQGVSPMVRTRRSFRGVASTERLSSSSSTSTTTVAEDINNENKSTSSVAPPSKKRRTNTIALENSHQSSGKKKHVQKQSRSREDRSVIPVSSRSVAESTTFLTNAVPSLIDPKSISADNIPLIGTRRSSRLGSASLLISHAHDSKIKGRNTTQNLVQNDDEEHTSPPIHVETSKGYSSSRSRSTSSKRKEDTGTRTAGPRHLKHVPPHILQAAEKYTSRADFRAAHPTEYAEALNLGVISQVCASMEPKMSEIVFAREWTLDIIRREARKYSTRADFQRGCRPAYRRAQETPFVLDEVCEHMKPPRYTYPRGHWAPANIQKEALQYTSRWDFMRGCAGAYEKARGLGILDKVCAHMKSPPTASRKLGSTAGLPPAPRVRWTEKNIKAKALQYKTKNDFLYECKGAYNAAVKQNILDLVCRHMKPPLPTPTTGIGEVKAGSRQMAPRGYWTYDTIKLEALKYTSRREFKRVRNRAYDKARIDGFLDEVCAHMEPSRQAMTRGFWTFKMVQYEAKKYRTRTEFHREAGGAYCAAVVNDWLPRLFRR